MAVRSPRSATRDFARPKRDHSVDVSTPRTTPSATWASWNASCPGRMLCTRPRASLQDGARQAHAQRARSGVAYARQVTATSVSRLRWLPVVKRHHDRPRPHARHPGDLRRCDAHCRLQDYHRTPSGRSRAVRGTVPARVSFTGMINVSWPHGARHSSLVEAAGSRDTIIQSMLSRAGPLCALFPREEPPSGGGCIYFIAPTAVRQPTGSPPRSTRSATSFA